MAPQARAQLEHQLDLQKAYLAEIPQIRLVPATVTFDRSLVLHEPQRDICLYYFGYAHTRGDVVVYLPSEKVVMTGDVLEAGVPLMRSAYPAKSINVLESTQKLDWDYAIPGHGGVQRDRKTIVEFIAYMNDLVSGVRKAIANGLTIDQAVESVNLGKSLVYQTMKLTPPAIPSDVLGTYRSAARLTRKALGRPQRWRAQSQRWHPANPSATLSIFFVKMPFE